MAAFTTRRAVAIAAALTAAVAGLMLALLRPQPSSNQASSELFLITGQIRLGVDPSHAPFVTDNSGQLSGFDVELAAALADQIQIPIILAVVSFDGLFDALLTGRVDALASVRSDQLVKGVSFTTPYADAGWLMYSFKQQPFVNWRDLSGHRLSVEFASEGDSLARLWLRRIAPFDVLRYETSADAFDALLFGHSDAALIPALTRLPSDAPTEDLSAALIASVPLSLAVREGDRQMLTHIQEGLAALEADGTLATLRRRWLGGLP